MKERKELKVFLVKNFLLVILGIALCEVGINFICSYWIFPVLRDTIGGPFFENFGIYGYGSGTIYISFFWLLVEGVLALLPDVVSRPISRFFDLNFSNIIPEEIDMAFHGAGREIMDSYYLGCFIILFLLLILAILPYILGALTFSWLIREEMRKLMEEEQHQHQEYERKRSLMLSDIAHDLKTPITTVSGYAQALRDGMITDEKKVHQYLNAICTKSQRMDDLISLLFEYVKVDSEGFGLHKERMDIVEVLRENIALFYADFERKGIEICLDIPEERIMWDLDKIQFSRAVANLLNNELRHVEKGGSVIIRLCWDEEFEWVRILFGDTGEQISDKIAKHIFEPFVMGDSSRNSKGGSGLGLSISSKIVKMHGGRLVLDRNSTKEYTKAFIIVLK